MKGAREVVPITHLAERAGIHELHVLEVAVAAVQNLLDDEGPAEVFLDVLLKPEPLRKGRHGAGGGEGVVSELGGFIYS